MKKIINYCVIIIFVSVAAHAQIKVNSVGFNGVYSNSFSLRKDLQISRANSLGAELNVEFTLGESFSLSLLGGYQEFDIKQDEYALFKEWNWRAWKRYYGDINDKNFINSTQWVQSILKDPNYSASFNTIQKMDFYPVIATLQYKIKALDDLTLTPGIGGGLLFYSRRLYVEETWNKLFKTLNNYTYSYSYRNMAENISGNPITAVFSLDANYSLGEVVKLGLGVRYSYVFVTNDKFGYEDFPLKDLFSAKLGIIFNY